MTYSLPNENGMLDVILNWQEGLISQRELFDTLSDISKIDCICSLIYHCIDIYHPDIEQFHKDTIANNVMDIILKGENRDYLSTTKGK